MGNVDQGFGTLPGGQALQAGNAVLGHQIIGVGAGIGHNTAGVQRGTDAAFVLAGLFVKEGGGQADEALATLGKIGTQHKVQLAACTGNGTGAAAFGVHLAIQVNVNGVVDGDKVIQAADHPHIVGVINGYRHTLRIVIQVVVHLLGAGTERIDLAAVVNVLTAASNAASLCHIYKRVHIHLGMYAQIFQVALGNHGADGVGHAADAKLQAGAVGDAVHHQAGNSLINFGGGTAAAQLVDRRVVTLDNAVNLGNVQAVVVAAQADRHVLVHFHKHLVGLAGSIGQMAGAGAEVEVAVAIHGGNHKHRNVQRVGAFAVVARQLGVAQGRIVSVTGGNGLALNAAHMPAVPAEVLCLIFNLEDFRHMAQDAAAEFNPVQLRQALGQSSVKADRGADGPAVIDPIVILDQSGNAVGRCQFLCINSVKIHFYKQLLCSFRKNCLCNLCGFAYLFI